MEGERIDVCWEVSIMRQGNLGAIEWMACQFVPQGIGGSEIYRS